MISHNLFGISTAQNNLLHKGLPLSRNKTPTNARLKDVQSRAHPHRNFNKVAVKKTSKTYDKENDLPLHHVQERTGAVCNAKALGSAIPIGPLGSSIVLQPPHCGLNLSRHPMYANCKVKSTRARQSRGATDRMIRDITQRLLAKKAQMRLKELHELRETSTTTESASLAKSGNEL